MEYPEFLRKLFGLTKSAEPTPEEKDRDEVISTLVFRELQGRLRGYNDINVRDTPISFLDKEQKEIDLVRAWANQLEDKAVKRQYLSWLDHYYERGLKEAYKEIQTRAGRAASARFRAEMDQHSQAVNEFRKTNDIPKPNWRA